MSRKSSLRKVKPLKPHLFKKFELWWCEGGGGGGAKMGSTPSEAYEKWLEWYEIVRRLDALKRR